MDTKRKARSFTRALIVAAVMFAVVMYASGVRVDTASLPDVCLYTTGDLQFANCIVYWPQPVYDAFRLLAR